MDLMISKNNAVFLSCSVVIFYVSMKMLGYKEML
jgi:hypothetical protein